AVGQLVQYRSPAKREYARCRGERELLWSLAESEDVVHGGCVRIGGVVEHLGDADGLDGAGYPRKCKRQYIVGEATVDSGREKRHPTGKCGLTQRGGERRIDRVRVDQRNDRTRRPVLAGPKDRPHVVARLQRSSCRSWEQLANPSTRSRSTS